MGVKMKALSLQPEWATDVMLGAKTVECRSWKTDYRGPLLICASSQPEKVLAISRHALCVVELDDIVPFAPEHVEPAMMSGYTEGYAWLISNVRWIKPFPVKGKLHIYDVDHRITYIERNVENFRKYYEPLMKWKDRYHTEEETREIWAHVEEEIF